MLAQVRVSPDQIPASPFWQATVMADYYETLAADYDWIFDDDALASGLAINHPATARLLERTRQPSVVLDAACGTGVPTSKLPKKLNCTPLGMSAIGRKSVTGPRPPRKHADPAGSEDDHRNRTQALPGSAKHADAQS